MARVLVIGGTGFIGESLVGLLAEESLEELSVVHAHPLQSARPSSALYYRLDASEGGEDLRELIQNHDTIAILIRPDAKALKAIASEIAAAPPRRVLYTSSALLYRGGTTGQKEDAPLESLTPYEREKYAEEDILRRAAKRSGSELILARLGNVYGDPRDKGIIGKALHAHFQKKPVSVRGEGTKVRDFIHVDDVASALTRLLLKRGKVPEVINVSTGKGTSIADLITLIESSVGSPLLRTTEPSQPESASIIADNAKLVKLVGLPAHDIRTGLKKTRERFQAWYDQLKRI